MNDEVLYVSLDTRWIAKLFWSDNPPANPETAAKVLSIHIYSLPESICDLKNSDNLEDYESTYGEMDVEDEDSELEDLIEEGLEFLEFTNSLDYDEYEIIDEEDAKQLLKDVIDEFE